MEDIVRMLEKAGLDTAGGIACTGSMEKYKAALRRFADSCGENTAAIEELPDSAARYIAEFMYDEAAAAVRELIPYIQPGAPD